MIDISVVIVSWNTRDLLLACIASLLAETQQCTFEIIVVDNASQDASAEAVRAAYPSVTVIENKQNVGFAKANNIGIMRSTGRYVCLVNTDIKVLDGALDRMLAFMEQNRTVGALLPKCLNGQMKIRQCCRRFPSLSNVVCEALFLDRIFAGHAVLGGRAMPVSSYERICDVDSVPCCFIMVCREAIDDVGLLDEQFFMYSEDIDWCKRFRNGNWRVVFYPHAQVIHYGGSSSDLAPLRFLLERISSRLKYWNKHHSKTMNCIYFLLLMFHYALRLVLSTIQYMIRPKNRKNAAIKMSNYAQVLRWLIFDRRDIRR